jgi:segregation and condensation protein A
VPRIGSAPVDAGTGTRRAASAGGDDGADRPSATHVTIVPGERPENAARVLVPTFEGPLALLLALIEQRQLDVLQVPLGDLAGAYLEALARLQGAQMPHISAFVTVCSQLILIKSRAILPRPSIASVPDEEGVDPEAELRERLILYRRYRDAAVLLAAGLATGRVLFHRDAGVAGAAARAGSRPDAGAPLDAGILVAALQATMRLAPLPEQAAEVMPRGVTLEERAAVIRRALQDAPEVVLQDLLAGVRDRVVVAITFMAMLELVKSREVEVEQREPWGPILCRATSSTARSTVAAAGDQDGTAA